MENIKDTTVSNCKHDFPVSVSEIPFARNSHFPINANDQNNQQSRKQRRSIIVGGDVSNEGGFYELIVDDKTSSINYKSFVNDYNKKFANLKCIGLNHAQLTRSYLVESNKYIVVYDDFECYNVYDIENDKWMLKKGAKILEYFPERSVLINDEIIIGSLFNNLCVYYIGNNHITDPVLMHEYTFKTKGVSFMEHGMCIIDFIKQESAHSQDKLYETYKLKIVLFGGSRNEDFLSSFLYLDILLSYQDIKLISISIDENLIDKKEIKLINTDSTKETIRYNFGFECFSNWKNEQLIIIIGGANNARNIYLFNCVTHELTCHQKVSPIYNIVS